MKFAFFGFFLEHLFKSHIILGKEYGTVFINIGRSNVIKEEGLLEALEKNWIREAILDVFDIGKQNQDCII